MKSDLYKTLYLLVQEISHSIVRSDNVTTVANHLIDVAINYAGAETGSLMSLNAHEELHIIAARGLPVDIMRNYRCRLGEGIAGTVAQTRLPVLVEDIETDPVFRRKNIEHYPTRSFISCPIISRNRLLGVININDKRDRLPFTSDELELVQIIANHIAIALENAGLVSQLKASAAEYAELNRKLMEADLLKTDFFMRMSHELRTPLNALKGAIYYLQQNDGMEPGSRKEFQDIITSETNKLTAVVEDLLTFLRTEDESRLMTKTAFSLPDLLKEISEQSSLKTPLKNRGITLRFEMTSACRDIMGDRVKVAQLFTNLIEGLSHYLQAGDAIVVRVDDDVLITVDLLLPRELPKAVLPYLKMAKYTMRDTHADEHIKLSLARHIADTHFWKFSAVNQAEGARISIVIPTNEREKIDAYVNNSVDQIVGVISEMFNLDICSIMLSDDLTGELTVKSARGLDDSVIKRTRIKFGDSIAGWVALEGKPLLIEDVESDVRFAKKSIPQYTTKSLISIPLRVDGRVIGVLNLNNKKASEPFTENDLQLASSVSDKIATVIQQISSGEYQNDDFRNLLSSMDNELRGARTVRSTPPSTDKTKQS